MDKKKPDPVKSFLAESDQYFYGNNFWQAPLYKQVEKLSVRQALWKPAKDRHCIWQLVRHVNFWKYWALKYANEGIKENAKNFNWAPLPAAKTKKNWTADIKKLKSLHEEFKKTCSGFQKKLFSSSDEKIVFLRTILYHDAYHAGQIGTLRSLQGIKPVV